jgi:uncharacterized repeat protein (TIGR01451 family)
VKAFSLRRISGAPVAAVTALFLLLVAMLPAVGFFGVSRAAATFNAEDYAQCSNDKPPSTALDCPGDWINGILNANNSHYAEDQVTPQRLAVSFDATGDHSVTLSYLARKGTNHAYDSLATWNTTQTAADRCQSLTVAICQTGSASTFPIPADGTSLPPVGSGISAVTSNHALTGQVFTMYGGTLTGTSSITHDSPASGDDFASITVNFTIPANSTTKTVQLLFGGHLATGVGPRGWGAGLGSSDINGGPYHIKWAAADGVSIGNRDNQIMSSAILPPQNTAITTQAARSAATIGANVTISDTATVTPSTATGSVSFQLFSDSQCQNPVNGYSSTKTLSNGTATSDPYTVIGAGTWYWIASFTSSDPGKFTDVAGSCGDANESISVGKRQPGITTTATTPVTVGDDISDTATLSNTFNATGNITFTLYSDSNCQTVVTGYATNGHSTVPVSNDSATSAAFTTTHAGNYYWIASYGGDSNNLSVAGSCGDANESSHVDKAQPGISTVAHTTGGLPNGVIYDVATVSDGFHPTGTVTFQLFGPEATPTCDPADAIALSGATVALSSGTAESPHYTPTKAGNYYWIATYNGDSNNETAAGACGDTDETSNPGKASPDISTSATGSVTVGAAIHDTATLTGGSDPTGTITFHLYSDSECQNEIAEAMSSAPVSNGGATSDPYTPADAGDYFWIAVYSGDDNNNGVSGICGDTGEKSTVTKAHPSIATVASGAITVGGGTIQDQAALSNAHSPTGTITFTLYSDANCDHVVSAYATSGSSTSAVSNGGATSATFTPTEAGTYYWIASYSGDANNDAVTGHCGDVHESVVVNPAAPSITTVATDEVTVGADIHDTATLHDAFNPTGTITFTLYSDSECKNVVVGAGSTKDVSANGTATSDPFTTTAAGTYYWIASYSGDDNNQDVAGVCGDDGEVTVVDKATPSISTLATAEVTVGADIHDTATLHNAFNPTGTVSFTLFTDSECTNQVNYASENPVDNGSATSDPYTTAAAGTYYWIASYSGDDNNDPVTGLCGDEGESSLVNPASPTITTSAHESATLVAPQLDPEATTLVQDTATLHGDFHAGGTVTFTLYGPTTTNDADCSGEPVNSPNNPSTNPVENGQAVSDAISVSAPGYYWWVASYSGDDNNLATAGQCGDANEVTHVTQPNVGLQKTADPAAGSIVQPGQQIDYTVSIPNAGDADLTGATVVDTLPAYVVVDESSISNGGVFAAGADITQSAGTITWTGVAVAAGESTDLTYTVHVSNDVPEGELLTNLAELGSLSSTTTHQVAAGDLDVSKSVETLAGDNVGSYTAGDPHNTLVYTLTGKATGTLVQHNVVVTDYIPGFDPNDTSSGKTTYVADSATCSVAGCTVAFDPTTHLLTWSVGTVTPPSTWTMTFKVTIDSPTAGANGAISAETIDNVAFVEADRHVKTPSNKVTTPVTAVLGEKVVKTPPAELPFTGSALPVRASLYLGGLLIAVGVALTATRRRRETEI